MGLRGRTGERWLDPFVGSVGQVVHGLVVWRGHAGDVQRERGLTNRVELIRSVDWLIIGWLISQCASRFGGR